MVEAGGVHYREHLFGVFTDCGNTGGLQFDILFPRGALLADVSPVQPD
jgi:hypothetical protein